MNKHSENLIMFEKSIEKWTSIIQNENLAYKNQFGIGFAFNYGNTIMVA